MFEAEALKALGSFPLVQAAVAILVVVGGMYALSRGAKDKNGAQPQPPQQQAPIIPQWLMMGPAHDAIVAIHTIAEQGRTTNATLDRLEGLSKDLVKEQREQTQLLEEIVNNQVLRGDITIPNPPPIRRK